MDNFFGWLFGTVAGWITAIVALIVVGALISVVALRVDTTMVQPEVKNNKLHSADASISNVNRYHTEIKNIISADNAIVTQLNQAASIEKANPEGYQQDSRYSQIMIIQLPGLDQTRHENISQYNTDASNTNYSMDLPSGYPHKIEDQPLPADTTRAISMLNQQVHDLQLLNA